MSLFMAFFAGMVVGGAGVMLYGMFAPRWKPGDYTRLVNVGFNLALLGAALMVITILGEIFFGG